MSLEVKANPNLALFKSQDGNVIAFQPRTLDIAEVSKDAWFAIDENNLISAKSLEIQSELSAWQRDSENTLEKHDLNRQHSINSITLNVTQICNLHCVYCAAGGDGTYGNPQRKISVEKTLPQLKSLILKTAADSTFNITFLGGEPLLYPEGIELICEYTQNLAQENNLNIKYSIITNGTIISEKILQIFKKYSFHITVSIDGPAEVNDIVRPGKASQATTQLIIENLQMLTSIKNQIGSLHLHGVFGEHSMEIEKAYDFYQQFNVDTYEFAFSVDKSKSKLNENYIKQMTLIAKKAWAHGQESSLRKINFFNKIFRSIDNTELKWNYCGAGKNYLMIDVENKIYTCPWDVGQKEEQVGVNSEIFTEKLLRYQSNLIELNNCTSCWARHLCGGGCMFINKLAHDDKHKKDELFCQRTQNLIALALMYYKEARA